MRERIWLTQNKRFALMDNSRHSMLQLGSQLEHRLGELQPSSDCPNRFIWRVTSASQLDPRPVLQDRLLTEFGREFLFQSVNESEP